MKLKYAMLLVTALIVIPAFGMSEKSQAIADKLTALMKNELQTNKIKDEQGNEMENDRYLEALYNFVYAFNRTGSYLSNNLNMIEITFKNAQIKETSQQLRESLIQDLKEDEIRKTENLRKVIEHADFALTKSKDPKALDEILTELDQAKRSNYGLYTNNYGVNYELTTLHEQLLFMQGIVALWQNYLAAIQIGNDSAAFWSLNEINQKLKTESVNLKSRPEIVRQTLENDLNKINLTKIVGGIKTLDDVAPAIKKIQMLQEIDRVSRYDFSFLDALIGIEQAYRQYLAGLPFIITPPMVDRTLGDVNQVVINQNIIDLRVKLLRLTFPTYVKAPEHLQPEANESMDHYIERLIADAKSREDVNLLDRIADARLLITGGYERSNPSISGFRQFLSAKAQEQASQYELATVSYQHALISNSDMISPEKIGERLKAIEKDHPDEYKAGMDRFKAKK